MKVLVVDDSRAMRMIVKRTLSQAQGFAGADITEASDGREALGVIQSGSFDLVLCDWNMPEMTGIQLLEALRAAGNLVTFGFVTSESTPEMYERAMATGAAFLITKPFTPANFELALARIG